MVRHRQLVERELAKSITIDHVSKTVHTAIELRAHGLIRCCLAIIAQNFDQIAQNGELTLLSPPLAAQLFVFYSTAPLQTALEVEHTEAVRWLIKVGGESTDWAIEKPRPSLESLVGALDDQGRTALQLALEKRDFEMAALLIDHGASPDARYAGGSLHLGIEESLLHATCSGRDGTADSDTLQIASLLLTKGADASAPNSLGEGPIDAALLRDSPMKELNELLIRHGSVSSVSGGQGGTILHVAAEQRRSATIVTAIPILTSIGVAVDASDHIGRSALHIALEVGEEGLVLPLLEAKASPTFYSATGTIPLEISVSNGNIGLTAALLEAGADCNACTSDDSPILVIAANKSTAISVALVKAGAKADVANPSGYTPLHAAVARGELELCELLLSKGARPSRVKDESGNAMIHTAVSREYTRIARLLVNARADLADQNSLGQTPLLLAAENGNQDLVRLLLSGGAGLDATNSSGHTALEVALSAGRLDTLLLLLSQPNVDINGITRRGSSLLHLAVETGDEEKVKFLLSQQAHIDILNQNGETPLHWACSLGHVNCVRYLLQNGADIMLAERSGGLTPLHAASGANGTPAALALLIQKCELMRWSGSPLRCNVVDFARNTPLHHCVKHAKQVQMIFSLLLEHGADASLRNDLGQTVLHLLAERAVFASDMSRDALTKPADDNSSNATSEFPTMRLLQMLEEYSVVLDAQENESFNTALHVAAFGGCIDMACYLVSRGAAVGLPNRDGFTPLDSMQPSGHQGMSLQELLLSKIQKPPTWTPDRSVSACQHCKLPFNVRVAAMARKHHCRHCGRCVCSNCSPRRMPMGKFGSGAEERVCLLCEKVLVFT